MYARYCPNEIGGPVVEVVLDGSVFLDDGQIFKTLTPLEALDLSVSLLQAYVEHQS